MRQATEEVPVTEPNVEETKTPDAIANEVLASAAPVETFRELSGNLSAPESNALLDIFLQKDVNNVIRPNFLNSELLNKYGYSIEDFETLSDPAKQWYFMNAITRSPAILKDRVVTSLDGTNIGLIMQGMLRSNPQLYKTATANIGEENEKRLLVMLHQASPVLFGEVIKSDPMKYLKVLNEIKEDSGQYSAGFTPEQLLKHETHIKRLYDAYMKGTTPYDRGEAVTEVIDTPEAYTTITGDEYGTIENLSGFKKGSDALAFLVRGTSPSVEDVGEGDLEGRLQMIRDKLTLKGVPAERIDIIVDKERKKSVEGGEKGAKKLEKQMALFEEVKKEFGSLLASQPAVGKDEIAAATKLMEEIAVESANAENAMYALLTQYMQLTNKTANRVAAVDENTIIKWIKGGNYREIEEYLGDAIDTPEYRQLKETAVSGKSKLREISNFIDIQKREGKGGYVTAKQLEDVLKKLTGRELESSLVDMVNSEPEWTEDELKLLMNSIEGRSVRTDKTLGKFKPFSHKMQITKKKGFIYDTLTNPHGFTMYMTYDPDKLPKHLQGEAVDDMGKTKYHLNKKPNVIGWSGVTPFGYKQKFADGTEVKKKALYMHEIQSDIMAHLKSPAEMANWKSKNKDKSVPSTWKESEHANAVHNYFSDWYKALYNDMIKLAKSKGYDEIWVSPSEAVAGFWSQDVSDAWKTIYDKTAQSYGAVKKKLGKSIEYMGNDTSGRGFKNDEVWSIKLKEVPRSKIARKATVLLSTREA